MSVAKRIREERERLGHTREDWAAHVGVHLNTQLKYERGDSEPDISYLTKIEELGADYFYIVSGERSVFKTATEILDRQSEIVFNVVKDFESAYEKLGIELSIINKAKVISVLYRMADSTGSLDRKMIEDVIFLAK